MYSVIIGLIIFASILLVFVVLAQNPKGGMAANFGASNQVMGARQATDLFEKLTWILSISILVLSLLASITMSSHVKGKSKNSDNIIEKVLSEKEQAAPEFTINPEGVEGVDAETELSE